MSTHPLSSRWGLLDTSDDVARPTSMDLADSPDSPYRPEAGTRVLPQVQLHQAEPGFCWLFFTDEPGGGAWNDVNTLGVHYFGLFRRSEEECPFALPIPKIVDWDFWGTDQALLGIHQQQHHAALHVLVSLRPCAQAFTCKPRPLRLMGLSPCIASSRFVSWRRMEMALQSLRGSYLHVCLWVPHHVCL